jgi:hypothetical protein
VSAVAACYPAATRFRAANRFLRRKLANARMKPPRPTGAWLVSDETSKTVAYLARN